MVDYLRANINESKEYANFKLDLFEKYSNDYFAYRREKDAYIKALKKRVIEWNDKRGTIESI